MPKAFDLKQIIGTKIGKLLILGEAEKDRSGCRRVLCKCECGKIFSTRLDGLRRKIKPTQMCLECSEKVRIIPAIQAGITHHQSSTKLYRVWNGMKQRCSNPNNKHYNRYGGRGIKVCDDWQTYIQFKEWAMTNGYQEGLTIDRIDNDGDYCPNNCKWVTMQEQQLHRCNTIDIIQPNGKRLSMKELSDITGIKLSTLYERRRKNKNISYEELTKNV